MFVVLGGTGNVGTSVAHFLLKKNKPVTVVTRAKENASAIQKEGAEVAEVDIRNITELKKIFQTATRAFILNPPANPSENTDKEERKNIDSIISALEGVKLEKLVLASTFGAHKGENCGDLTVLYEFEQRLKTLKIPLAINRGAYYFSNWLGMIEAVQESGRLPSFFPTDLKMPMVAPSDLGFAAASRLLTPSSDTGIEYVEGPERYTATDVASVFSELLDKKVEVDTVPTSALEKTFSNFGFSESASKSYACMTKYFIRNQIQSSSESVKGQTSLFKYLKSKLEN